MKRFCMLFVILLFASVNWISHTVHAEDESRWMPDADLRNAVRTALNLNADEPLTQQKMLNLNVLNASQQEIMYLTGLEYATNLRSLSIWGNKVSDLTPLMDLVGLTQLYIGNNLINDISPLVNLTSLNQLGMLQNQITDINALAGLVNLEYLRLAGNPITDTSPLVNLPKLSDVDIEIPSLIPDVNLRVAVRAALGIEAGLRITIDAMRDLAVLNASKLGITDLTGLEYATNLRSLSIGGNKISDLTPLMDLMGLTRLYIGDNLISDIRPLANLTSLNRLGMLRNQITDINALAGLINLEYLRLAGNPITNLCPLEGLIKLSDVDVEISSLIRDPNLRMAVREALGIETSACITIDTMKDLTTLNASRVGITSLAGLEYAINLKSLSIPNNRISDLTPLANLTRLTYLSINGNVLISDISPLANLVSLQRLEARQNRIRDISILAGLVNLEYLRLAVNPIIDTCPLINLPKLTDVDVYISCPPQEDDKRAQDEQTNDVYISYPPQEDTGQSQGGQSEFTQQIDGGQQDDDKRQNDGGQSQYLSQNDGGQPDDGGQQVQQNTGRQSQDPTPREAGGQQQQEPPSSQNSGGQQQQQYQNNGQQQQQQEEGDGSQNEQEQSIQFVDETPDDNNDPQQSEQQQQQEEGDGSQNEQEQSIQFVDETPDDNNDPQQSEQQQQQEEGDGSQNEQEQSIQFVDETPDDNNDPQQSEQQQQEKEEEEEEEEEDPVFSGHSPGPDWGDTNNAPSINGHKMFIMDSLTLEQLDPETLQAQLDLWRTESDGSAIYLRSIALLESVLASMRPEKTALLANYPNPFNPETWIPYHLANPSDVQITIYDARGNLIRRLELGHQHEGYYTSRSRAAYWNGRNDVGERVASGIYFYQLQTENVSLLRKMVILK